MWYCFWEVDWQIDFLPSIRASHDLVLEAELAYQADVDVAFVGSCADGSIEKRIVFEVRVHPASDDGWHRAE